MGTLKKVIFISIIIIVQSLIITESTEALYITNKSAFPNTNDFVGKWKMQSIVTSSNCPYIIVGSTTESNLEIRKSPQNILNAIWRGGNWKDSITTLQVLSNKEAVTKRVTEINIEDMNIWKTILIDHLWVEEEDTIHSESIARQFKNDKLVGEYKTFSILVKVE